MATLASSHLAEGFRASSSDQFPETGPSFTAVNGTASPTPPVKAKSVQETPKDVAMETNGRPSRPSSQQDRPMSPHQPDLSKPETATAVVPAPPVDLTIPHAGTPGHQRQENGDESKNRYVSSHSRTPSSQQSKTATMSPQKRKRSYSNEYDDPNSNPTYHSHALPDSPERPRMYANENGRIHEPENMGTPAYPPPPEHPELYPRPERQQMVRGGGYDQRIDPSMAPAPRPYYSDERMVEALQRENQSYDAMGPRENFVSPEDEDDQHMQQYGDYGTNRSSLSGPDLDRKRRKRVFSNRTKTGCMTCRRRKKKCDEGHPECNNCLRGGFVCEGYTIRNTWQKPPNPKAPVPLQSKHGYPVPIHRAPSYQTRYSSEVSPEYPGPPASGPHPPVPDGDRVKPILVDEDRDVYSKTSPSNVHGKSGLTKTARPSYSSNPPHISKYQPETDYRAGPVPETPYEGQEHSSMHPPVTAHRTSSSSHSQYSMPTSQPPNHNSAQAVAQTALQQSTALRPYRRPDPLTEREKMLKGNYYYPFSPTLVEDRERCIAAIWRFNNATNPSHGASPEERARLFRAIVNIRPNPEPSPSGASGEGAMSMTMPQGSVGERVVVEAPFHCDYGYNITIGDDVLIGADCRISDTCSVSIGARCIFSPNVKLVCATYPIDPRRRMGSGGQALGRSIVIEEDCWIGSNVTILAGVRVGKSSTVGAGSLLHNDVPRFTVVAGNPAKVSRGIYDGQDGL